jgi:hypothetical protein
MHVQIIFLKHCLETHSWCSSDCSEVVVVRYSLSLSVLQETQCPLALEGRTTKLDYYVQHLKEGWFP